MPVFTFRFLCSGGINTTIAGTNFQSVFEPLAIVTLGDANATVPCQVQSEKVLSFFTPTFPVKGLLNLIRLKSGKQ